MFIQNWRTPAASLYPTSSLAGVIPAPYIIMLSSTETSECFLMDRGLYAFDHEDNMFCNELKDPCSIMSSVINDHTTHMRKAQHLAAQKLQRQYVTAVLESKLENLSYVFRFIRQQPLERGVQHVHTRCRTTR